MAGTPERRASDGATFYARTELGRVWLAALIPILLVAGLFLARAHVVPTRLVSLAFAGAPTDLAPTELAELAADVLDASTKAGGQGYRFEIVQTSTMVARPGGPRIPIPDPLTRGTLGLADRYYLHTIIEQGVVRPDGFSSQMRAGPQEGGKPDWSGAQILFEALVRDGQRWRNDGEGWYEAGALPGIGLDPETAAGLPGLLRAATTAVDVPAGAATADPDAARTVQALAKPAEIPGIIAADGAAFTKLTAPVAYGFDDGGRLVSVAVSAINTNMTEFDLVIETRIAIAYDPVAALPEPKPVLVAGGLN